MLFREFFKTTDINEQKEEEDLLREEDLDLELPKIPKEELEELNNSIQKSFLSGSKEDAIEVEKRISDLFSHTAPSERPLLEAKLLLQDKELRHYEYNKRLNQLRFLSEHLKNEKAKEALEEIVKLVDRDVSVFGIVDNVLDQQTQSKYNLDTNKRSLGVLKSIYAGAVGGGVALYGSIALGIQDIQAMMSMTTGWVLSSGAIYINSRIRGNIKKKKQERINNMLEGVESLFDRDTIRFLQDVVSEELDMMYLSLKNKYREKAMEDSWAKRGEGRIYGVYQESQDDLITKDPDYVQLKDSLEALNKISQIINSPEMSEILPNLEFLNEFTELVNEIYRMGGDAKSVEALAKNIVDSYMKEKASVTNNDLIRLLVRSGLTREDTPLNRQVFTSDITHILKADYVKFLEKNDQSFRGGLINEMTQKLHEILPFNDKLVRYFLSKDVEEGTLSSDYRSEYELANTSFKDILNRLGSAKDLREKNDAINFYKQKNEFEQMNKMYKRIPWLLKSSFYKKLLKMAGYEDKDIVGMVESKNK